MEVGLERDQVMRVGNPKKIPTEDRQYCFEEKYLEKASSNQKHFDYKLAERLLQSPKVRSTVFFIHKYLSFKSASLVTYLPLTVFCVSTC